MTRDIKFRAWDKEGKIMLYGIEGCYDGSGSGGHLPEDYFGGFIGARTAYRSSNAKRYEVMQFTGLKDKNRKEIYEGDIVCLMNHPDPSEVKWSVCCWVLRPAHYRLDVKYEKTVIGNVFENPELLKS